MFATVKTMSAVLALAFLAASPQAQAQQTRSTTTTATHIETRDIIYDAWTEYVHRRAHAADLGYAYSPLSGMYRCNIDGRRADMGVTHRGTHLSRCDRNSPNLCSLSVSWVTPQIQFRDHGWNGENANAPFIFPTYLSGWTDGFSLRHPDGNTWTLNIKEYTRTPTYGYRFAKRLEGNTTWRGRQYPLSCDRVQNGAPAIY